jgi:hypothetical protein
VADSVIDISKLSSEKGGRTYGSRGHALIGVVVSTRSDIFKSQHESSISKRKL